MIHLIDTSRSLAYYFPCFSAPNSWMGDRKSNRMEVSEKAVGLISGTAMLKPFRIRIKQGKLLSPITVPFRGIRSGNIRFVKGVQDAEEAINKPNSAGSEGGKVSCNHRGTGISNEEIYPLNFERKQLNKQIRE